MDTQHAVYMGVRVNISTHGKLFISYLLVKTFLERSPVGLLYHYYYYYHYYMSHKPVTHMVCRGLIDPKELLREIN